MTLPEGFTFSQASLQDFSDCRRRFQLRYLERLDWPAVESEPVLANEDRIRAGQQFHTLLHQHQLGIPAGKIQAGIRDAEMLNWWQNYVGQPPDGLPEKRLPEHVLSVPLGGFRLLAKFDLLAFKPAEQLVVVDWKTSRKIPGRTWLANRLQTLVYRYVALEASAHFNGGTRFEPDQVSLVYWFANDPAGSVTFPYSTAEHETAGQRLGELVNTIAGLAEDVYFLTDDASHCRFCPYRSLCDRGVSAGQSPGATDDGGAYDPAESFELDLEQVIEIAF